MPVLCLSNSMIKKFKETLARSRSLKQKIWICRLSKNRVFNQSSISITTNKNMKIKVLPWSLNWPNKMSKNLNGCHKFRTTNPLKLLTSNLNKQYLFLSLRKLNIIFKRLERIRIPGKFLRSSQSPSWKPSLWHQKASRIILRGIRTSEN